MTTKCVIDRIHWYRQSEDHVQDRHHHLNNCWHSVGSWCITYASRTLGISAIGAFAIHGYNFQYDKIKYNLYHLTQRVELQPWWLVPTGRGNRTKLKIGAGLGSSFQSGGSVYSANRDLISVALASGRNSLFLAPDITLFNLGRKNAFEIGLRYVYHLDRSAALTTTMTVGTNSTTASATNDDLGLVFRYHIGSKKKQPPLIPVQEVAFQDRDNELLTTLKAKSHRITIEVWDNAEVDGDTISVLLNDEYVLFGHGLTKRKERIIIDLPGDHNILEFVAHNEGRVAPYGKLHSERRVRKTRTIDPHLEQEEHHGRDQL